MKKSTTFIISTYLLLATSFVYAQAPAQQTRAPQPPSGAVSKTKVSVIADVRVVDVTFKESNGTYTGGFNIMSNMGMQNGIGYGIVVVDPSVGKQISYERLGIVPSLKEGEMVYKPFSYTLPPLNASKVQVLLVAESDAGLRYSVSILAKDLAPKNTSTIIDCAQVKDALKVTCTFKADASISYAEYEALFSPTALLSGTSSVKKGETKTFTLKSDVKRGVFVVKDEKTKETSLTNIFVPGAYGIIKSLAVTEGKDGLNLVATVRVSPFKGSKATYTLKDKSGASCGQGHKDLDGLVIEDTIKATCKEGTITLALFDKDNNRLDQKTDNFSVIRVAKKEVTPQSNNTTFMYILIAVLALIIASLIIRKVSGGKLAKVASVSMFFLAMSMMSVGKGEALSMMQTWSMGEIAYSCNVYFSLNKSSYTPGEIMEITGSVHLEVDANIGDGRADCYVYRGSFDTPYSGGPKVAGLDNIHLTYPATSDAQETVLVAAPMTTGSHYFGIGGYHQIENNMGVMLDSDIVPFGNTNGGSFTVAEATPPAVNLNFSTILDSAKHSLTSVIVALKESVIGVAEAKTR